MLPPNNVAADEKNFSLILKTVIIFQTKLIAESKGISKMKTTWMYANKGIHKTNIAEEYWDFDKTQQKKLEFLNECCGAGSSNGNQNMKNDNA